MIFTLPTLYILLAAASGVSARTVAPGISARTDSFNLNFIIRNWCDFEVFFYQDATVDKCIKSAHGACSQAEAKSISAWSGSGEPIPQSISRIPGEVGKSIKITRKKYSSEVFQFEYNLIEKEGKLYFDLSDLDGKSPSVSGSPFYEFNVKATPHGIGVGDGTCATIRCEAEEICEEAYQTPTDEATKVCTAKISNITLDLCIPETEFKAET